MIAERFVDVVMGRVDALNVGSARHVVATETIAQALAQAWQFLPYLEIPLLHRPPPQRQLLHSALGLPLDLITRVHSLGVEGTPLALVIVVEEVTAVVAVVLAVLEPIGLAVEAPIEAPHSVWLASLSSRPLATRTWCSQLTALQCASETFPV